MGGQRSKETSSEGGSTSRRSWLYRNCCVSSGKSGCWIFTARAWSCLGYRLSGSKWSVLASDNYYMAMACTTCCCKHDLWKNWSICCLFILMSEIEGSGQWSMSCRGKADSWQFHVQCVDFIESLICKEHLAKCSIATRSPPWTLYGCNVSRLGYGGAKAIGCSKLLDVMTIMDKGVLPRQRNSCTNTSFNENRT